MSEYSTRLSACATGTIGRAARGQRPYQQVERGKAPHPRRVESREAGKYIAERNSLMKALRITDVKPGRQAQSLGIKQGDYIISYNGVVLDSDQALSEAMSKCSTDEIKIVIYRDIDEVELIAKPGALGISTMMMDLDRTNEKSKNVLLTTSHFVEGFKVVKTHEIITSECVYGMNLFKDFFASITDVVGGRSNASQTVLRDLRKTCLKELKLEAVSIGANAVIAVDLDYSEFSGGGKSMLFLVASGTAVTVEPMP